MAQKKLDYDIVYNAFSNCGFELLTPESEYKNSSTNMDYICRHHRELGVQKMRYATVKLKLSNGHIGCPMCTREKSKVVKKSDDVVIGIYKITNNVNGKIYIGKSQDIYNRWWQHEYEFEREIHYNPHFQRAWTKYGKDNFIFEIIEECTLDNIDEKEIYWIDKYNATNPDYGYNLRAGGEGGALSEDVKERIGISQRGNRSSLLPHEVFRIRECLYLGMDRNEICKMFNTNPKIITAISTYDTYDYILPELKGKLTYNKKKALEERNQCILNYFDNGHGISETARDLGYTNSIVEKVIYKYRPNYKKDNSDAIKLYNQIIELYSQGMSNYDIGKKLGIKTRKVKRYTEEGQIPGRKPSNAKMTDKMSQFIFDKYFKEHVEIKEIVDLIGNVSRNLVEAEINTYLYGKKSTPFTHEQCA